MWAGQPPPRYVGAPLLGLRPLITWASWPAHRWAHSHAATWAALLHFFHAERLADDSFPSCPCSASGSPRKHHGHPLGCTRSSVPALSGCCKQLACQPFKGVLDAAVLAAGPGCGSRQRRWCVDQVSGITLCCGRCTNCSQSSVAMGTFLPFLIVL